MSNDITIVIPIFRNADVLTTLIERIHESLDSINVKHCILAVDDMSPDNSWDILKKITQEDSRLGAIQLASNAGQHKALLMGLSLCSTPWVGIMDADLQDPPEILPRLFEKAKENQSTVFAKRYGEYENGYRLLLSKIHKTLLSWLTGVPRRCGTFFVTSNHTVKKMLGYNITNPQVVVMVACASNRLETLDFKRAVRPSGTSAYTLKGLFKVSYDAYKNVFYCWRHKIKKTSIDTPIALIGDSLGWIVVKNQRRNLYE